ncbi:lactate racemase domain-containing protein [Petroclostridium sp. X23]|uniref:lactate racemase domain-containing protein n=1 Tax=Petroclostridium sp. X23 TaxID=3045146 RepID=UPI0024ADFE03|nr:lactate racemase domain-containing protein [Petroclostridium sp. X23]WHH60937.1 lactate racemase domain-containing protein [Petroclostridium sp. X23]
MKLNFEYGNGLMEANLPDNTDVFVPGETVADPPLLQNIEEETRKSILNPIGLPPIAEQVRKGSKVTIVFPDKVKGGFQETSHRKTSIPIIIEECLKAGVEKKDIKLICSNGLHRKNTKDEIKSLLGEKVFNEFWWSNQIVNHDSEDWDNLVDLGTDECGSHVIMNKEVFESDLAVLIGHTLGNPYGGYSGGYKHCSTGITHWRCIGAHHIPHVMHRDDFTPVNNHSLMRKKFDAIGQHMEKCMGKKFFTCDAVLDTCQRQIAVFTGYAQEIQPLSWGVADKRTYIPWADKKYDIVVFGMPQAFHYGNGHGTNPLLMLQAISAQIIRHKRILSDNCVIICSSVCNGYFHDEEFPSYREVYELFQKDYNNVLPDVERYGEYLSMNKEYIDKYRYNFGYHPYHAFSMISCGHIAEKHCSAIYIVGAQEPGYARGMGMKTRATFEEALKDAKRYVGENPNILALPRTFKTAAVHLMMKNQENKK